MATWDDVRRVALGLPEVEELDRRGNPAWQVRGKVFAWERPLRRSDLAQLGDTAPQGELLAARVPDLGAREAVLAEGDPALFTIPHFEGFPAVLAVLELLGHESLEELLTEAWLCRAPKRLAAGFRA